MIKEMKKVKNVVLMVNLFEGEYLNDIRYGKGRQYCENGNLKFEGEFIDNEIIADNKYDKNGNIIYQYNNSNKIRKAFDFDSGNLKFEGEYLNDEKHGKGKEYNHNCNISFEGECLNGKKNAKGKEYDLYGNLAFEGEYLNGLRNGKGKEYYDGNLEFAGEYLHDLRNGKGKKYYTNGNIRFEGEYLNNQQWKVKAMII